MQVTGLSAAPLQGVAAEHITPEDPSQGPKHLRPRSTGEDHRGLAGFRVDSGVSLCWHTKSMASMVFMT